MENIQTVQNIENVDTLFLKWLAGHPGMSRQHFRVWLAIPSREREIFFLENTRTTFEQIDSVIITKSIPL